MPEDKLQKAATEAMQKACAACSDFPAGCAILAEDGKIHILDELLSDFKPEAALVTAFFAKIRLGKYA